MPILRTTVTRAVFTLAALMAVPGCATQDTSATAPNSGATAPNSSAAPQTAAGAPQTGGADAASRLPTTTTIDGKAVPLKVTPSGLRYYDIKVGTGPHPNPGQSVSVQYTGTLLDGTKFDSSYDHGQPFDFPVGAGQVIPGWDEGVPGMKVGGKRRLVIPGDLAYGPSPPPGPIPPNATLVFDIELVGVK